MHHPLRASVQHTVPTIAFIAAAALTAGPACADPFFFSTGDVDGKMASASRPGSGSFEIEAGDDFIITGSGHTRLSNATFTGLLTGGATASDITEVRVEIYRVFPNDSDVGRTSGPPLFSTLQVPTRVNSPSDVALADRDSNPGGGLTFQTAVLSQDFTANNSVQPGGIHAKPGQTTGGDGAVTGIEVGFSIDFTNPFDLPADHYFFIPQVEVTGGDFLWLSAPKPIVAPGTPFLPDLQAWTRDQFLDPDWLRIGTDIVGGSPAPTFNLAFSLTGATIPEPATLALLAFGLAGLGFSRRKG